MSNSVNIPAPTSAIRVSLVFLQLHAYMLFAFPFPSASLLTFFADATPPLAPAQVKDDYTPNDVPSYIKGKVIENDVLYGDVLNAGAMAGTKLSDTEAANRGLIKNHWMFRAELNFGTDGETNLDQIQFGMSVKHGVGSNEVQYAMSDRSDPDTASDVVYSPVGSFSKPLPPSSDEGILAALPLVPATGDGSHDSHDSQSPVLSDVDSVSKPPDIVSSDGHFFQQPTKGAPYPGVFNIKIRQCTEPSRSAIVVFQLRLAPNTTFGQLLEALVDRHMVPFFFRKIKAAYLGCRDFVSQATAAWLSQGLLVSAEATMVLMDPLIEGDMQIDDYHIFSLLGWRYTEPLIPDIKDPSDSDPSVTMRHSAARSRNFIDHAIWSANFIYIEDERLKYNQVMATATV